MIYDKGGVQLYQNETALIQDVKQEVLADLQREGHANVFRPTSYTNSSNHMPYWHGGNYDPYATNQMYQSIKESVKNEVLGEAEMQQANQMARIYGIDHALSDRKLQQMIDARYRLIDDLKEDIKRELRAFHRMDTQRSNNPYVRDIANTLAREGQRQGIPIEQLISGIDRKAPMGTGMVGKFSNMINTGQRKGFLYGVGCTLLFNMIWPMAQSNMRSIAVRSMEEGLSMVDKAKTFMRGNNQQNPSTDYVNVNPEYPNQDNQPPDGNDSK